MANGYPLLPQGLGNSMNYGANAPYNMLGNRPITNNTMLSPGYGTPDRTSSLGQPSQQSSLGGSLAQGGGLTAAFGPLGTAAGIGLGIKGFFDDKKASERAEAEQERQLDIQRSQRDMMQQRYISELDSDSARRGMIQRGQMANTPEYQAMMSNLGRQSAAVNQTNQDQMIKQGMGSNSGMAAQMASQNASNLGRATAQGMGTQIGTMGRVYGGLGPYAMSSRPEQTEYARQQGIYNEASDYGSNLAPLFDLAGTGTKHTIGETYRGQMRDDIAKRSNLGYGVGKSGGNV